MAINPIPFAASKPISLYEKPPEEPGLLRQSWAALTLGVGEQVYNGVSNWAIGEMTAQEGYDPWTEMKGYEDYASTLVWAKSPQHMSAMKNQIDINEKEMQVRSVGGYWILPDLLGGAFDGTNYLPVPIARGLGFWKGAAKGAASNFAQAAVTDPLRIAADPTASWEEYGTTLGTAAIFGSIVGAGAGSFGAVRAEQTLRARRAVDQALERLSEAEGVNLARAFDAAEERYQVVSGRTNTPDGEGQSIVEIVERDVPVRSKEASDGKLYHYDDTFGWVAEADRGKPDPAPVDPGIVDELGIPARTRENVMVVDELRGKVDFENGRPLREGLAEGDIRTGHEYVTFKQIEAVFRRRLQREAGESDTAFKARVRDAALRELKASRAPSAVARRGLIAPWLDKLNRSPTANAIRLFADDTLLTDLPLKIAGDYGWATRANEFGYKTPPSMLLRAMRHNRAFFEIKAALDEQWVKFSQQNAQAKGATVYNQNLSAAVHGVQANLKNAAGGRVISRETFARMAGQAVFDQSEFTVDGFTVVPEAREAAKVWTRTALRIEAQARELGIFYDQAAIERTFRSADAEVLKIRQRMLRWMWGGNDTPAGLDAAIRVGDRIFTGRSHEEALMRALDELGPDTPVTNDMYGYVPRREGGSSDMLGPINQPENELEWMPDTGFEPVQPKFTVQVKDGRGEFNAFEYTSFDDYEGNAPEFMKDQRITDEASFQKMRAREVRSFFDRSLWQVADDLLADGMTLTGQESRNGYNGVTYRVPGSKMDFFLSAQAHAFLKAVPPDRLMMVQQTLDRIFPERLDPKHDATLTSELTNADPSPEVLAAYNLTEEEWRAQRAAGGRTYGRMTPYIMLDQPAGKYQIAALIRVAVNKFYTEDVLNTAWHEGLHALRQTGRLTDDEWSLLVSEAKARGWHEAFQKGEKPLGDEEAVAHGIGYWAANPEDPRVLGKAQTPEATSLIERIIAKVRELAAALFGEGKPIGPTEFEALLKAIDEGEVGRRAARQFDTFDEAKAFGNSMDQMGGSRFRTVEETMADRMESMTDRQRSFLTDWQRELDAAVLERDLASQELEAIKSRPHHEFRDQYGNPEPYFGRYWNHTAIASERQKFEALLTKWYERDNPTGAAERAAVTVDNMLKTGDASDVQPMSVPGLRHLQKRSLDIPNSFTVNDPVLGELKVAQFINTNLEAVSEAYIRGMGHKIEAARMFGDTNLSQAMRDARAHFRDRYLIPAEAAGLDTRVLEKKWQEYRGWIELIRGQVLGGLRQRDPWAIDNRVARGLKNWASVTSMGRVLLTALTEAGRIPMVNGFRQSFPTIFSRFTTDMKVLKENLDLNMESGEIGDLAMDMHGARIMEGNEADPGGGGSYIERLLERSMPGFYKLTGLTHWTVMAKDMIMLGAQHKIMDLAKNLREGNNAFKLASWGISERDAMLLASMPVERKGSLILPAVQHWQGADGMRARTLLLDAIHAEARRAIVTPSAADKNLLFHGVLAWKGKKIGESDVFTLPLQFMSYGMAAGQKVLMSALQGRDQDAVMGALAMMTLGTMVAYLSSTETALQNKTIPELMFDGYEKSGVGAFVFSDLNQMIERYSRNQMGLRPMLGMRGRFGNETGIGGYADIGGPGLGMIYDLTLDQYLNDELSPSNRAQAIRRAIPLNNLLWFAGLPRYLANKAGQQFE